MIELKIVTELAMQYTANGLDDTQFTVFLISLLVGMFGPMMVLGLTENKWSIVGFVILVIPLVLGVQLNNDNQDIRAEGERILEELNIEYDGQIKDATCDDVRLHIVDVLENKHSWYVEKKSDWTQELYYHKCEVPLRDEVLKLQ